MPVTYAGDCASLEGQCTVEEAGELTEWLLADRTRAIDLAACTGLHSAVLQTIMALVPPMIAGPQDATLARWLAPVLPPLRRTDLPSHPPSPAPRPQRARASRKASTVTASPSPRRTKKGTSS